MTAHPIPPFFDSRSRLLILGSFPSVMSRESGFFYGHPQNRFWRVTAAVFGVPVPGSVPEKKAFLAANGIALYDVIAACDIRGSADAGIRNVVPCDLRPILAGGSVRRVFVNGKTALRYYELYGRTQTGMEAVCLPSTSPANAAYSLDRLIALWRVIASPVEE